MRHRFGLLAALLFAGAIVAPAQRTVVRLDGDWDIEEGLPGQAPQSFTHKAPVPGLGKLATPAFANVDRFDPKPYAAGSFRPARDYFWYRTSFKAPEKREVARLVIRKAQFGVAAWLNGQKIGEHLRCFSSAQFDIGPAVKWATENELVIRIGAHPGVLPASVPCGVDGEKKQWTAGIYDEVFAEFTDGPFIETVQVAPRVASGEVVVQTTVRNSGSRRLVSVGQRVKTWKGGQPDGAPVIQKLEMAAGETKTVTQTLELGQAVLWSPENPFLYALETSTGGDSLSTRFGMREFRFDTPTRRAYLNRRPIYLRGSNITLHRFFEDEKCGRLPWTESWVRKLLADIPRRFHWNAFRFCIGPVPDKWLDIADEVGLLIQNEYFIWGYRKEWDTQEVIGQFKDWMRDNWNHPSVVLWDASNETRSEVLTREIVPVVRRLDLSNRPWENGYNPPGEPDDPVENHPYENFVPGRPFELTDLEAANGGPLKLDGERTPATAHAMINNEYASFWLTREGEPTFRTKPKWDRLLPNATSDQRLEFYAYLVGGLTEYWRAHRNFAAVLHFVLLTAGSPELVTCDSFRNVERLELEPNFEKYVEQAFKPLGVYLRFWRPTLKAGSTRRFEIMMINDEEKPAKGDLLLSIVSRDGRQAATARTPFSLAAYGAHTYELQLTAPGAAGDWELRAAAQAAGQELPTISRRKVRVER